jgi:hypothetical protein
VLLIPLRYNIIEEVLELVELAAVDYIFRRLVRTRQNGDVSADAQRPAKNANKSELEFICQTLWGKKKNKCGQHKPGK